MNTHPVLHATYRKRLVYCIRCAAYLHTAILLTAILFGWVVHFSPPLYAEQETPSSGDCEAPATSNVDWSGCDKRNSDLQRTLLRRADLRNADLRGADLRGAILYHANLAGADLRGADLQDAVLDNADLRFVQLDGVNLDGTMLAGADLRFAQGLPSNTAAIWAYTLCPDDTSSEWHEGTCQGHFAARATLALITDVTIAGISEPRSVTNRCIDLSNLADGERPVHRNAE